MKIQFNQNLVDLAGENIVIQDEEVTLRSVCVNALLSEFQNENSTGEDKVKRYELAKRIYENDELELEAKQIALLQERVGKNYLPLIVGQATKMLEGEADGETSS